MKTKKNAGFSLVELIVVIAIMAVLVGVLAPAYLKYVEKSRKSTDVSAVADMITASSTVAADVEYDVPSGATFSLTSTSGANADIKLGGVSGDTLTGWQDVANVDGNGYKLKSKEFKGATAQTISGTVADNGSVGWPNPGNTGNGTFNKMVKYSKDLESKFE